jgi:NADH dehydrogenase
MKTLVVTGATGYIGCHVVACGRRRGWVVIAATRTAPSSSLPWIRYRLEDEVDAESVPAGSVIIHLAAETDHPTDASAATELRAAERLSDVAQRRGARVIFVSSQTARSDAPTIYGRGKWRIEQEMERRGHDVVRPGLVYGGAPRGIFAALVLRVRAMPVLPALWPAPLVQPIHVDDFATALLLVAERADGPPARWCLAAPESVSFTRFLRSVARDRLRVRRLFVPFPGMVVRMLVRWPGAAESSPNLLRLHSLIELPRLDSRADLATLGVRLRGLETGMHPSGSGRRRRLASEGRALIGYVLGQAAPLALVRRYVQAIEKLADGAPLSLPGWACRWPALIALFDQRLPLADAGSAALDWRLCAAVAIAEASPVGARAFLATGEGRGRANVLARLVAIATSELAWRFLRLVLRPVVVRAFQRSDARA